MGRKSRIHLPGGYYHVIVRGNNRRQIFFDDEDRIYYEKLISEGVKRFKYKVHAYCFMSNHVHLLLQVSNIPLSKIVQKLSFRYTRYINKKESRVGHLFQGRYKSILIDADNYLLELVRYIHLNPVRAKIVKKPENYKWSGHQTYIGIKNKEWLSVEEVLKQYSKQRGRARRMYSKYISEVIGEDVISYDKELKEGRILGEDNFIERVLNENEKVNENKLDMEKIIKGVCEYYEKDLKELRRRDENRSIDRMRNIIGYLVSVRISGATST